MMRMTSSPPPRLSSRRRSRGSSGSSSSSDEPEPDSDMQRAFQLAAQRSAALEDYRLLMQVSWCGRVGSSREAE